MDHNRIDVGRRNAHWQAVQRGTVQHEIFEGARVVVLDDDDVLRVTVNCRADAGRLTERIPYVLAVTLEVDEGVGVPVYERVRARLMQPITLRA